MKKNSNDTFQENYLISELHENFNNFTDQFQKNEIDMLQKLQHIDNTITILNSNFEIIKDMLIKMSEILITKENFEKINCDDNDSYDKNKNLTSRIFEVE